MYRNCDLGCCGSLLQYHYSWVDWIVGLKSGRGAFGIMPIGVLTEKVVTEIVEKRKSRNLHTRDYFGDKNKDEVIAAPVSLVSSFLI